MMIKNGNHFFGKAILKLVSHSSPGLPLNYDILNTNDDGSAEPASAIA
jgi:hypothetical protein